MKENPTYNIINFDCLDYCSCIANLEEVDKCDNYKFVKGDITSSDLVTYVLKQEKVRRWGEWGEWGVRDGGGSGEGVGREWGGSGEERNTTGRGASSRELAGKRSPGTVGK